MQRYQLSDVLNAYHSRLEEHGVLTSKAIALTDVLLFGEISGSETRALEDEYG